MAKQETKTQEEQPEQPTEKKRYTNTRKVGPAGSQEFAYLKEWRAYRRGLTDEEPANEVKKLVKVEGITGDGERNQILVYEDQVDEYAAIIEEAEEKEAAKAQEGDPNEG